MYKIIKINPLKAKKIYFNKKKNKLNGKKTNTIISEIILGNLIPPPRYSLLKHIDREKRADKRETCTFTNTALESKLFDNYDTIK